MLTMMRCIKIVLGVPALFLYPIGVGRNVTPGPYEKGFIVLISPIEYFSNLRINEELQDRGLFLGINTLVFYETRQDWNTYSPQKQGWQWATSRSNPLGGQYIARIPATTSNDNGANIFQGFTETSMKGAGIRAYEYASNDIIRRCRLQLEALFWLCVDSETIAVKNGMSHDSVSIRKDDTLTKCESLELLDFEQLKNSRILNATGRTICPLCLEELSSHGFFNRMEQAEGREVNDLTITQLNLFHINELRYGVLNHRPYNLGWGHHHCNVVVKDSGISNTLVWMGQVLDRNIKHGYFPIWKSES